MNTALEQARVDVAWQAEPSSELNVDSIRHTYDLARKYGVVEKDINLDDVLPKDG